ncbi:transcription initiation factor IIA gamma subunit [Roridomyces roridus]|uniref:Transcription initiation factor IIA subunit 2 n=1 Tax=Roridomyces roridus TaxID=1738132 RepID=A0AAD7BG13_9AGAR|nr:transcription initiation factor IIA gamma subunit [Roridomyces roridus]
MPSTFYEIYRGSPLGIALCDSVDDYVRSGEITEELGRIVLAEFDRALADAMANIDARASIKGHLRTYRNCVDVWYFSLRDATFKMHNKQTVSTSRVKIVACKHGDAVALDLGVDPETGEVIPGSRRGKRG